MSKLYKCCNCERLFREDDFKYVEEPRGEFWGIPCSETMSYSPCCEADYEEYEEESDLWICKDCGLIWRNDEIIRNEVSVGEYEVQIERECPDCLEELIPYIEED